VLARDGDAIGEAFRGKSGNGHHAEYALLQHELKGQDVTGTTLYTTLEPCTIRGTEKTPCANWIISRSITEVVIGMIDPNRTIQGDGFWLLSEQGIKVSFFDQELIAAVARDNEEFIRLHRPTAWLPPPELRSLDDWYYIINSIYLDRNSQRAPTWMFSHLVEVVGGLSTLASDKTKPGLDPKIFIAKCLGWWFALCGVVGLRSVEDMVWWKYPRVCSYCRLPKHDNRECRKQKEADRNPKWDLLADLGRQNVRPKTVNDWCQMFYDIYPVTQGEDFEIVFARLSEELGELAECVRVLEIVPTTFLSEGADVFAWLMKLANLYVDKKNVQLDLNILLAGVYPDRCVECKNRVCSCPPILPSTVTRIAHEGPSIDLFADRWPFFTPAEKIARFDVGAKQVHVGRHNFVVTGSLIEQVFILSRDLQALVRVTEGVSPQLRSRVEQWATMMTGLATGQRVSQRGIDELLLTIRAADEATKLGVRSLLTAAQASDVRNALLEYIDSTNVIDATSGFDK
jgi:pyrimidine deaminase RibD-like protein